MVTVSLTHSNALFSTRVCSAQCTFCPVLKYIQGQTPFKHKLSVKERRRSLNLTSVTGKNNIDTNVLSTL